MDQRGENKSHQLKVVLSVRVLKSWALEGWRLGDGGWGSCTAVFTGTVFENVYRAFVPLLKNPEPKLIGKEHDGGRRDMEGTV